LKKTKARHSRMSFAKMVRPCPGHHRSLAWRTLEALYRLKSRNYKPKHLPEEKAVFVDEFGDRETGSEKTRKDGWG